MQTPSGRMDFEFELGTQTSFAPRKAREDTPFCIAILADFSGRGNRGSCETGSLLAARRRIAVDVDNLELLPKQLGCELNVPLGGGDGPRVAIGFGELTDFHPDRIFDRLEIFQKLKILRKRLQDPATFAEAASQVRSWLAVPHEAGKPEAGQPPSGPAKEEPDTDTLERLLGKQPAKKPPFRPAGRPVDIEKLIGEVVKPYIIPAPDPQQPELIAQVDQAISGQMRAILHQPDFKELEAAWLLLRFIVSQVETNETLKIYIIDVSKAELAADLASCLGSTPSRDGSPEGLQSTGTYRLLVERSIGVTGANPYALLLGCYKFDQTSEDIALLHQLACVAQAAGAPLVACADSHFAGCPSLAATPDPNDWRWQPAPGALQLWQQLRGTPEAAYIGLLLPRFLLRLPYGSKTDPVERFGFEEFSPLAGHEQYLWGNSAGLCACLLANAFSESGWNLTDGLGCDLTGLPMHIYESDGQKHVTPCAETILTERAFGVLIDKGLMPVVSVKGRDAVRLPRFQSISHPPAPLAGPWR
ncbi:MAG: type VI secretion system contractile sheath large subunit [Sedimentisphaerales bacterium]|nr:type VI secretion system contractile sheath large subunit [Sedimentisphaerales bacterium]